LSGVDVVCWRSERCEKTSRKRVSGFSRCAVISSDGHRADFVSILLGFCRLLARFLKQFSKTRMRVGLCLVANAAKYNRNRSHMNRRNLKLPESWHSNIASFHLPTTILSLPPVDTWTRTSLLRRALASLRSVGSSEAWSHMINTILYILTEGSHYEKHDPE
jgi:hypothetical protein